MMQWSSKQRVAYLSALALLFSYVELLIPRVIPFLRLGLGNVPVLLGCNLDFGSFVVLTVIKSVCASMVSGTLFSPFVIVSLCQSVASGLVMFGLSKCRGRFLSVYGISMAGSAVSAVVQIAATSLYLGQGTFALLSYMLLFSLFSGIFTAWLSIVLHIPEETPVLENCNEAEGQPVRTRFLYVKMFLVIAAIIFVFAIRNVYVLLAATIICLVVQFISGRRIRILPYVSLWLFVFLSTIFIPNGKIIFSLWKFNITQGALLEALSKSLKLTCAGALSQTAAVFRFGSASSLPALVMRYNKALLKCYHCAGGNVFSKMKTALSATKLDGGLS